MSLLILAIAAGAATFAIVVIAEAAWQQRRENAQRQQFELALTAAQRLRWRNFEAAGGVWREFADLLQTERNVH
jgi:hypothetical protein